MWTQAHRATYRQSGRGLPSDLTDAQWQCLEPLIPAAKWGGRPRKTDMRAAMNAIFYLLRTGCPWRYLPRGPFPPRSTVYNILPLRTVDVEILREDTPDLDLATRILLRARR